MFDRLNGSETPADDRDGADAGQSAEARENARLRAENERLRAEVERLRSLIDNGSAAGVASGDGAPLPSHPCADAGAHPDRRMTPAQLEVLTLRAVDQVRAGQPVEDARIELKRELPADPYKAARRIGGHANASRGQPVVWIIGLDETEGVRGADAAELSDWWPQVQRYFDDLPPEFLLQPMNVPVEGDDGERLTVVALAFDTSRLPFVVTAKGQAGPIQREIPYRSATGLRSAKRSDILRLLSPATPRVEAEVLRASVDGIPEGQKLHDPEPPRVHAWKAEARLYLTTSGDGRVVCPKHDATAHLIYQGEEHAFSYLNFIGDDDDPHVTVSGGSLIVSGPGAFTLRASGQLPFEPDSTVDQVRFTVTLRPLGSDLPLRVSAVLDFEVKTDLDSGEVLRALNIPGRVRWGVTRLPPEPKPRRIIPPSTVVRGRML